VGKEKNGGKRGEKKEISSLPPSLPPSFLPQNAHHTNHKQEKESDKREEEDNYADRLLPPLPPLPLSLASPSSLVVLDRGHVALGTEVDGLLRPDVLLNHAHGGPLLQDLRGGEGGREGRRECEYCARPHFDFRDDSHK